MRNILLILITFSFVCGYHFAATAQQTEKFKLARIKYRGGGDWYNDPSSLKNLAEFASQQVTIAINPEYDDVALGSSNLSDYPFAFLTGHGNIKVNEAEISNLRTYLNRGGFLYIDDDYGLDEHLKKMLTQLYPNEELVELPFNHSIYHQVYDFPEGLPKIHKHDGKTPQGLGLFHKGRLVIFYTYETNLADGWANPKVHNDPAAVRQKALQMGTNILIYALTHGR
ncbi:protein of unknown function (DUF4159) [Fodinibius salinus]|uniref:DUF4159 domain-containing protein n=1 Tax=Fodinibius salinus TaxID=860790 RepID=A0A5D3YK13_9BACT|nr:DUF4159 domain-containing protein [Fodinibius salinus]TYP92786.1 protein of unknown function (DUF4159) [Fodinibius salinus]